MNGFGVQQLPAEGSVSVTTEDDLARMSKLVQETWKQAEWFDDGTPPSQRLTVRVAFWLQDRPNQEVTSKEAGAATAMTTVQANGVLDRLMHQRTDVIRVRRGVYKYVPGGGRGLKSPQPSRAAAAAKGHAARSAVAVPVEVVYRDLPGAVTKDGQQVVQRSDGRIFYLGEI